AGPRPAAGPGGAPAHVGGGARADPARRGALDAARLRPLRGGTVPGQARGPGGVLRPPRPPGDPPLSGPPGAMIIPYIYMQGRGSGAAPRRRPVHPIGGPPGSPDRPPATHRRGRDPPPNPCSAEADRPEAKPTRP